MFGDSQNIVLLLNLKDSQDVFLQSLEMMVAKEEVDRRVLVSAADSVTGTTPLMFATIENRMQMMERLLALGCDINKRNKENYTALHFGRIPNYRL